MIDHIEFILALLSFQYIIVLFYYTLKEHKPNKTDLIPFYWIWSVIKYLKTNLWNRKGQ